MLFNSSVYIIRHPVRLADKNCDISVITLYGKPIKQNLSFTLHNRAYYSANENPCKTLVIDNQPFNHD